MTETDLKISQLPEETTPQNADVFAISVDLGSTPTTKKITLANLITAINKPAGSSGQIQFNDAGAFGGSDNLFWDSVNGRLGIGTTSPGTKLHIGTVAAPAWIDANSLMIGSPVSSEIVLDDGSSNLGLIRYNGAKFYIMAPGSATTLSLQLEGGPLAIGTDNAGTAGVAIMNGNVGIGTVAPTISSAGLFHMNADTFRLDTARTPASAGAAGNAGEYCWDADYLYCCVATNTWKKVAIATW